MLSDNESVSPTNGYFENLYGVYEVSLFVALFIVLGFHYLVSFCRKTGSQHHVICKCQNKNTENLIEENEEQMNSVQGEPKPDQQSSKKLPGDVISKCADKLDTSAQTTKKKRNKKKPSNLGQKDGVATIANQVEGDWNWNTGTVSCHRKQHSNQIESSLIASLSTSSQDTTVEKENKPENQQDLPEVFTSGISSSVWHKGIEEIRRILETNHSSDFADGSASSEEWSQGNIRRRKKRISRSMSSTGTVTPILPKLTPIGVCRNRKYRYVKYTVEIGRDGGILKLNEAQIKFLPCCIGNKVKLFIAFCQNQKVRRGEGDAIFVTQALHIWQNDTSDPDDFKFNLPIRVEMDKLTSDNAGSAKVQRTNSIKNIFWEFYCKGCDDGNTISFNIKSLGGYRAVCLKHDIMTDLHYQICVTRTHETDDPDQLFLNIKFYTEDMQKFVLAEAKALPELEVLKSESIHVQAGSLLLLSLRGIGLPDLPEKTVEFKVPEYLFKLKRTFQISLRRLPPNFDTPDPLSLLLQMSSQFSHTVQSPFYFQWKKALSRPTSPFVLNVNGTNAIGIQSNYQNTIEIPPGDHRTSTLLYDA